MKTSSFLRTLRFAGASLAIGLSARAAAAEAAVPVIELPPLEVSGGTRTGRPWTYVEIPETEVLSRCSPRVTREFLEAQFRLDRLLDMILPAELRATLAVPRTLILTEPASQSDLSQNIVTGQLGNGEATKSPSAGSRAAPRVRYLANLRLDDVDSLAVYALVDESSFSGARLQLAPEYVRFRLERRTPRLPGWFFSGFLDGFTGMDFNERGITLAPMAWADPQETERIRADADYPATLLPMEDVLAKPCPEPRGETLAAARLWRAQAALFVRWMIEDANRRALLAKFASRAAERPVTNEMCREILGYDYAALRDQLNDYLRDAVRNGVNLKADNLPPPPEIAPRTATPAEIARTKGDWDRLEVAWVRARQPDFLPSYTLQARRTLASAGTLPGGDARVHAILGLLECDLGNDGAALPYLEAAMTAQVVRPRIYFEIARLRYEAAIKSLPSPSERLTARQVNAVLEPFKIGHTQAPPLRESYRLITEAWSRSTADLGSAQFALCDEGVRLFPDDAVLLCNVAVLKLTGGKNQEAATLARRALQLGGPPALRARVEKILTFATSSTATASPATEPNAR